MPDLVVQVDTKAHTLVSQFVQADSVVASVVRQGVLVDTVVLAGSSFLGVEIDSKAQKTGIPVSVQVDSKTSARQSLGLQVDSQVRSASDSSVLVDSMVVTRKSGALEINSFAKARVFNEATLQVDTIISKTLDSRILFTDSIAIPVGKVFNPIFISYHYKYPPIES